MSSDEFIVERNVECVVCPGCAFTFDRYHIDTDGDGYSCPVCDTVGHLGQPVPVGPVDLQPGVTMWVATKATMTEDESNHGAGQS